MMVDKTYESVLKQIRVDESGWQWMKVDGSAEMSLKLNVTKLKNH